MNQEEKKDAHPMMIMVLTWVCVSLWGFPCTSINVISSGVTYAKVATVSLNWIKVKYLVKFKICRYFHPIFDARLMKK